MADPSKRRFQSNAALLEPATRRMEQSIADVMCGPVITYVKSVVSDARQKLGKTEPDELREEVSNRLAGTPSMTAEQLSQAASIILNEMQVAPDELISMLEPIFINRARILASSRPEGPVDLKVNLPDVNTFVHKILMATCNDLANATHLFVLGPSTDRTNDLRRQNLRTKIIKKGIKRAFDMWQPPCSIARRVQVIPLAPAAAAAPAPCEEPADASPAPEKQEKTKKKKDKDTASLKDLGFEEEEEKDDKYKHKHKKKDKDKEQEKRPEPIPEEEEEEKAKESSSSSSSSESESEGESSSSSSSGDSDAAKDKAKGDEEVGAGRNPLQGMSGKQQQSGSQLRTAKRGPHDPSVPPTKQKSQDVVSVLSQQPYFPRRKKK
jgi:hypothetical protein